MRYAKKRAAALTAAFALLFAGCEDKNIGEEKFTEGSVTTQMSLVDITEMTDEFPEGTETLPDGGEEPPAGEENIPTSLLDLTPRQMQHISVHYEAPLPKEGFGTLFTADRQLSELSVASDNSLRSGLSFVSTPLARPSTGLVCSGDDCAERMNAVLGNIDMYNVMYNARSGINDSAVYSTYEPIFLFDSFGEGQLKNGAVLYPSDMLTAYNLNGAAFMNVFIRDNGEGYYEIIPDPAYCDDLPVMHLTADKCTYNINGRTVCMDSPRMYIWKPSSTDGLAKNELNAVTEMNSHGNDYVYAKMRFTAQCCYSAKRGYVSFNDFTAASGGDEYRGSIYEFELLSEDTSAVLDNLYTPESTGDPLASRVYSVLMDNADELCSENTLGIDLIDLDLDGVPEVIADAWVQGESSSPADRLCEAKIYRIENSSLVYVDTLYTDWSERTNFISRGLDHNNKETWFFMSAKDVETGKRVDVWYTFDMKGGKLDYTEIFRFDGGVEDITYLGKPLDITHDEATDTWYSPVYNAADIRAEGYASYDLTGMIEENYCQRFPKIYGLYNPTLCVNNGFHSEYDHFVPMSPDKRTLSYKLAYVTDAYFNGEYLSDIAGYTYHFYGDYEKPVIYLYPESETEVTVELDIKDGYLTCTYPDYGDGWKVTAYPDGTLIDSDGREYSYLYWEAAANADWDMSEGFVVKGEDTAEFLREKLSFMGLTPREYNDFIVYWLPRMQDNRYNLITFRGEDYTDRAKLNISPQPDSLLRIFMVYAPLDEYIDIPEQPLKPFTRTGFTAIEWGGAACRRGQVAP